MNFEDIKVFEKSNFWCKIVAQPTPFLGQIEPKYVQVGPILVQFGHVLNLHLLSRALLSNSSPSPFQSNSNGLGVDFVFPLSQEQQEQQEEPSPKS